MNIKFMPNQSLGLLDNILYNSILFYSLTLKLDYKRVHCGTEKQLKNKNTKATKKLVLI